MKKVKFIYNPNSGDKSILSKLDYIIDIHQQNGFTIFPYRIEREKDVAVAFNDFQNDNYDHILIAGGDGTVDSVINAMYKNNIKLPVGILPTGTANDFAKFLKIPFDIEEACRNTIKKSSKRVDIAKINDKYFVNVASTGLFTDVSKKTDTYLKNTIGKLAYYLKGIEELPNFRKINISIKSKEVKFNGEVYLLLVFNGQTAGNFKLAGEASVMDGLLDVIAFKTVPIRELLPLFIRVLRGEHLESDKVLYFKTKKVDITCTDEIDTDIDGEVGPSFPLTIECVEKGIEILGI